MEDGVFELDVVVEPHLRAPETRLAHLRLNFGEVRVTEVGDRSVEHGVVASDTLHTLKRLLSDLGTGIDTQCFRQQRLPRTVIWTIGSPRCEQRDGFVRSIFFNEPSGYFACFSAGV